MTQMETRKMLAEALESVEEIARKLAEGMQDEKVIKAYHEIEKLRKFLIYEDYYRMYTLKSASYVEDPAFLESSVYKTMKFIEENAEIYLSGYVFEKSGKTPNENQKHDYKVRQFIKAGFTVAEIAKFFKVNDGTMRDRMKNAGISRKVENPKNLFCRKCEDLKPVSEFYKDSSNNTGYKKKCKSCMK